MPKPEAWLIASFVLGAIKGVLLFRLFNIYGVNEQAVKLFGIWIMSWLILMIVLTAMLLFEVWEWWADRSEATARRRRLADVYVRPATQPAAGRRI